MSEALAGFVGASRRLFALTGAGCSTGSGIPDYRDASGQWKRKSPVNYNDFVRDENTRRRYWARSFIGWPRIALAAPNAAHRALAALERGGKIGCLLTQNVDGLHQAAGSQKVIDLHGRLDAVRCLHCSLSFARTVIQQRIAELNPEWAEFQAPQAPDGDADLEGADFAHFTVPACEACGGMLKPDVVFFGESVPRDRVAHAMARLDEADAMLVVGSSLMVYSGFRFVEAAARRGIPIACVNLGRTRADELFALKVEAECGEALAALE